MTVVGSSVDPLPSKSVITNNRVCVGDLQNEWTKNGDNMHVYAILYIIYVTVPRKRDLFRKINNVQYNPNTDKKHFLLVFFLLAHRYLLPFSYTDTKFAWLKPLLKVRAPV